MEVLSESWDSQNRQWTRDSRGASTHWLLFVPELTELPSVAMESSRMMHQLHRTSGLMALVLLALFVINPSLWSLGSDGSCGSTCPCDPVADANDAQHDSDPVPCSEGGSGEQCPQGCGDCSCCPGATVALMPSSALSLGAPNSGAAILSPLYEPTSEQRSRVFRPPKLALL